MHILITSGGTSEAIDSVRSITNHSTGSLGKILTEAALAKGHQVTLITTPTALKPDPHPHLLLLLIENVEELLTEMQKEVPHHQALIHAMAVSDYTPVYMTGLEEVEKAQDLHSFIHCENQEAKISSREEYQVLFLKKNPKIISFVKEWNPAIQLIGFKLLVDVSSEELIQVAHESLVKNHASMIVANDLTKIQNGQHQAYLVTDNQVLEASTKTEIAEAILNHLQ
ncbi:phosphopantothenate--cysteine ligase [Streptococcus parasanguinis]|uniref:Phosphopantothenate--cysteine ligase n=1 Tax=Streptococcus parasanguinis TaxID=1318 RepID=A0A6I3P9F5_STRPA|nr:phosphopantothenate--cysteine ligase [Streptococcus parasanguinis]MTR41184.1 phosphopantothenate--cysteine ligase [Streptococcus parasanguinis]